MKIEKKDIKIYASPKAVIVNYLKLPGEGRIKNILNRTSKLNEETVELCLQEVMHHFHNRHRNIESVFIENFKTVERDHQELTATFSEKKRLLAGSFFTKEYSIHAAALFNPSIIPHPDQQNLEDGDLRFIMTLRATGEGHISSIVFKTGVISENGDIKLEENGGLFTCISRNTAAKYDREFILNRIRHEPYADIEIGDSLPSEFSAEEGRIFLSSITRNDSRAVATINLINEILDSNYELVSSAEVPLNEKVIFPTALAESMGMEDVRMVKFIEGENITYYGTYTAYNGKQIKTQLLETTDFNIFRIRTLYGPAISDKGMALFPEKINGKYAMISRQGGETINIMYSNDLYHWDKYDLLMEPIYPWELVQLGNCGSPVKTNQGWLVLTHGVGALRTYVKSAILLDLVDPSKIIGRLNKPLLKADEEEREGYVPNVVYTCGYIRHGEHLIIPYAVSDSTTGFATIKLNELLSELIIHK